MITATYASRNIMTRMDIEKKLDKSQKTIRRLEKKIRDLEKNQDLQNMVEALERRIANLEARPQMPPVVPWDSVPGWPQQPWAPCPPNPHWIDRTPFNPPNEIITTCQVN